MNARLGWTVVIVLALVIAAMAIAVIGLPAPAKAPVATTTAPSSSPATSPQQTSGTPQTAAGSIVVSSPQPNASVAQSFTVSGEAPNTWYFEAVFPVQVRDDNGDVIGRGEAQAQTDWTISGTVPFTANLTVDASYHGPATLILHNDNPSGLPENDDSIAVPIVIQ